MGQKKTTEKKAPASKTPPVGKFARDPRWDTILKGGPAPAPRKARKGGKRGG